ncbi:MAG TPA: sigma factor [Patescibacteria group bacterium]|nr:sigma factor [Patescibacteria group bacterium]
MTIARQGRTLTELTTPTPTLTLTQRHCASCGGRRAARMLQADELATLLQRSARGERASQDRIVAANLALVIRLADQRSGQGLPVLDLIQEGSLGLVEAVRTFDGADPRAFAGFAEREVGGRMDAAIEAEAAAVRDGQLLVAAATDYERTELILHRELKRAPTERDIAEKLEWTVERTRYIAEVVTDARRRHDEELMAFIDPEALDFDEHTELDA